MISKDSKAVFTTTDGVTHDSLKAAQLHELENFFPDLGTGTYHPAQIAQKLQDNADALVEILSLKSPSRPKARKARKATTATAITK